MSLLERAAQHDAGKAGLKKSRRKRRKKIQLSSLSGVSLEKKDPKALTETDLDGKGQVSSDDAIKQDQGGDFRIEPLPLEPPKESGRRHEMFPGVSRRLIRTKKLAKNLIKEGISSAMDMGPTTTRPRSGTLFSQLAVLKRKKKYDRTPHDIFVQLDQFTSFGVGDGQGLWLEKARWIKYEENMDWEGPLRWGKPHVPLLSFYSLLDLRHQLISGTIIFDLKCDDYESMVTYVVKVLQGKGVVHDDQSSSLKQTLFAPHKFPHTSQFLKFVAIQNWLSTRNPQWGVGPLFSNPTSNKSSNDVVDKGFAGTAASQRAIRRSSSTPAFHRNKKRTWSSRQGANATTNPLSSGNGDRTGLTSTGISPSLADSLSPTNNESKSTPSNGLENGPTCFSDVEKGACSSGERRRKNNSDPAVRAATHISSLAFLRFGANQASAGSKVADIRRRIPKNAEAASVLVGSVSYLDRPLSVFVRLVEPIVVQNLKHPSAPNSTTTKSESILYPSDSGGSQYKKRPSSSSPESSFSTSLLEVPSVPVRFVYILLGPYPGERRNSGCLLSPEMPTELDNKSDIDYYDLGRCFSTLMANKFFQDIAYQATHGRELVLAFNEFLNESIVLPAGELNPSTLLPLTRLYKDRMLKNLPKSRRRITRTGSTLSRDRVADEPSTPSVKSQGASSGSIHVQKSGLGPDLNWWGKCSIFKGLRSDIKCKRPWYVSDFKDAFNSTCLLAVLFIYLTSMPPSVTFGGLLSEKTDNWIGVSEIMVADSLGGIVFALFAGQPLMLLTVTGPLLVFEESLYQFTRRYEIDYIAFRFWMGLWVALITVCFVAFDGSRLIKYFTRFIEEIFALTIALVFIYEVLKKLYKLFARNPLYAQYCHLTLTSKKIENKSFVAFQKNLMLTDSYIPVQRGKYRDEMKLNPGPFTKSRRATDANHVTPLLTNETEGSLEDGKIWDKEKPKLYYYQHSSPGNRTMSAGPTRISQHTNHPVHPIFYRGTLRRFYNYYYNNVTDYGQQQVQAQGTDPTSVLFFYAPSLRYHDINFTRLYAGVARAPDGHLILDRDFARCKVVRPNTALFSTILVLATFFAAFFLRRFRREGKFLTRTMRRTLGDFGPPIALLASACVDSYAVGLDVYTEKLNLHSGPPVSPTLPDRRGWLVYPMGQVTPITLNTIGFALIPAAMLFILLFIEGQLTALLVNKRQRKLRKSHGYHLDLLVIGLLQIPMGALGLPWISPAPIQSLAHVACLSIYNTREHAPGDRPTVLEVKEQRVTSLLISLAMGLTLVFGSGKLQTIPVASLFGVFLYLGVSSLTGIQFFERLTLLITSPKYYPRSTNAAYIRKISYPKIHLYTFIQFSCLALLWALKFTPLSLFFPLVLLSIVPLRYRLGCLFTKQELYYLDMDEEEASEDEFDFYTEAHMPV